jgi:isoleucyl-tRNA synthetase
MEDMGADILRLWVINSDYSEDLRIGTEMLKHQQEIYRRYRNTLRYLLGALKDYASQETISYKDLPNLEKYILHRVYQLEESAKKALENFDFHRFFSELHNFVSVDLSAFYFDVRKDTLYCDTPCSLSRRSVRTVMFHLFEGLIHWLAPVLSFTAEEAYLAFYGEDVGSIHLKECPKIPSSWSAPDLAAQWSKIRDVRRVITGALEQERARGTFGSSLQAEISVYMSPELTTQFQDVDIAEMSIVSQSTLLKGDIPEDAFKLLEVPGVGVHVSLADGQKCERCWKILPEVGNDKAHETLCQRCVSAVSTFESKVRTA